MDYISNHAERALARLVQQYKARPGMENVVRVLSGQVQQLEDAAWGLYMSATLDTATHVELDRLGALVGEARQGSDDEEEYRQRVRAKILVNRGRGTVPEVLTLVRLFLPDAPTLVLRAMQPAYFEVDTTGGTLTAGLVPLLVRFLRMMRAAGVQAVLRWRQQADDATFAFDGGTGLGFGDTTNAATGGAFAGAE